ncbi:hypothetical protein DPMN_169183 [Dreissena polymorpha]|uniref:Uncharacterized protein n=1 Tax=Dreissena polymorpha TaxID=45954 RepID=A0A9D4F237_DREPO|nr:hypothetical protein DPMN_169183 [Dreissena polymorpha]
MILAPSVLELSSGNHLVDRPTDRQTDIPTDRQTDMCKAIYPLIEGGHKNNANLAFQWVT